MTKQLSGNSGQLERHKMNEQDEQEYNALLLIQSTYTQEDNLNNAMVRTPEWKLRQAAESFFDAATTAYEAAELRLANARAAARGADTSLRLTPEYKAWAEGQDDA